jgi:signal transduction histidine kinase
MTDHEEEAVNDVSTPDGLALLPQAAFAGSLLGPHAPFGAEQGESLSWAQRLEDMGRRAARVAHEINNQVTLLLGQAELLLHGDETSPTSRARLTDIRRAAERIGELSREWLAVGGCEAPAPRRVDLNGLLAGMVPRLADALGGGVEMTVQYRASPGLVVADRGQLEAVIVNLVLNARDAMAGHGRLTLTTANARLDASAARYPLPASPGSYVMLVVRDTGCGMDEKTRARIFDHRFTTKPAGKGTGVGLTTVWEIVKGFGGTLQVASTPGEGTTFAVFFPRAREGVEPSPPPQVAPRETVLVLGDEDLVRNLYREVLAREGYQVLEAHHAPEAVQVCAGCDGPIDLVVLDSRLPPSASDVVRRLRELYPGLRVLHTSAYADGRDGPLPRGHAFLAKPFPPAVLAGKVRGMLDGPAG